MGNAVTAQLASFGWSVLMGLLLAVVYDLLRTVRLRRGSAWLMHGLDALYVAALLLVVLLFALRQGEGELRLYMLLGMALGAAAYAAALHRLLQPVWSFWVDALAAFAALLWRPVSFAARCGKKVCTAGKKHFHFWRKYVTISMYKWNYFLFAEKRRRKGGSAAYEKKKAGKKARRHRAAGGGAADRRGGH